MTASRIASALAVAAATCLLVLVAAWPRPLTANEEKPAAEIQVPTLNVEGLECSIQPIGQLENGKEAKFLLTVRNTTTAQRDISLDLSLRTIPPVSPGSRMIPLPTTVWTDGVAVEIGPEQTRTVELSVGTLPAGALELPMICGDNGIIAWTRAGNPVLQVNAVPVEGQFVEMDPDQIKAAVNAQTSARRISEPKANR